MYIITGSLGLIGYSASIYFLNKGIKVLGVDNDLRSYFFWKIGSNNWKKKFLKQNKLYDHFNVDIRNKKKIFDIFKKNSKKIKAIIHTAAQPSHDWAAKEPFVDYNVNTTGTLNLLEAFKKVYIEDIFTVKTRASRMEYWGGELIAIPGMFVVVFISYFISIGLGDLISNILIFWSSVATITVSIRRMHDVGKSGWVLLWNLTIIGTLYTFVLSVTQSEQEDNEWGSPRPHTILNNNSSEEEAQKETGE